ncbi:MAG: hypothetical protein HYU29_07905 [Chloroflexi bacterium]|nr:hypothetical protein [Chloroflexota bacterium]
MVMEESQKRIRMSDLMSAISMASDLAEGQTLENGIKTCYVGMRLAEKLKLSDQERSDVYYACLLDDLA